PVPPENVGILFQAPRCQPKLMLEGRDFARTDGAVRVRLAEGPYGVEENVWTAVTGLPETAEALASIPQGAWVVSRLRSFAEDAASAPNPVEERPTVAPRPPAPGTPAPQPPARIPIKVSDPEGKPIAHIYVLPYRAPFDFG